MKIKYLFLIMFLSVPVMAGGKLGSEGNPIPVENGCFDWENKKAIQWLGKLVYMEVYDPPKPCSGDYWPCTPMAGNITAKDNIEIGLREDGVVVWRKMEGKK